MSTFTTNTSTLIHAKIITNQSKPSLPVNKSNSISLQENVTNRRKLVTTFLGTSRATTLSLNPPTALALNWGNCSFLWEHFFEPDLSPEDAVARIKQTAEGLHSIREMLETMSWRYVMFYIRLKQAYLSQDLQNALSTLSQVRQAEYVKIANEDRVRVPRFCSCGRRHFSEAATSALLASSPSLAFELQSNYKSMLNRIHPPRPDWYEEFYAWVLSSAMEAYEAEIAPYKSKIFANLRGKVKQVVEMGIGTGPNLKYYANGSDVHVFGVDPNRKMEKYALKAAVNAGLPPKNFKFIHAVGEAIPLGDASVDAVVGTLVLCSVKDVDRALQEVKRVLKPGGLFVFVEHVAAKDGTSLRLVQNVLDPLQQIVADGCHLTRETGKEIFEAGFSGVDLSKTSLRTASIINPHVYGTAVK